MKNSVFIGEIVVMCAFALAGCDEDSNTISNEVSCTPACTSVEICVDGVCRCGEKVCDADEICQNGKCEKTTTDCTNGKCEPVDACNGACKGDEVCVDGVCKCGDEVCAQNEQCQSGHCENDSTECDEDSCVNPGPSDSCNGQCSEEETCVEGICKCGDIICAEQQVCRDGLCLNTDGSSSGDDDDDDEDIACDPACAEGTSCVDGECQPDEQTKPCNPKCQEGQICNMAGVCVDIADDSCHNCIAGETCVDGSCMCGKSACKDNEVCKNEVCVLIDPCAEVTCTNGKVCFEGKCKKLDVSFNKETMDVYLSSKSPKLTATRTSTKKLKWTINGIASSAKFTGVRCIKPDNTYSQILDDCIVIDKAKGTETVQFVGLSRKPKTMKIKVVDSSNNTAEAALNLKPYFDMDTFVKLNSSLLRYRNTVTPGQFMTEKEYTDLTENKYERYANLCGEGNIYCRTSFNDKEAAVFDEDMYVKYIRPKMIKYKNKYYGTRASVVAAARFLILQFPYDIPYARGGTNNVKTGRGHYIWGYWAENNKTTKTKLSEVAVFGLNLTSKDYSSSIAHESIRDNVVPWGAYDGVEYDLNDHPKRNNKYQFNGLECSGFVTWAFRNGRLGLGDWTTHMFARNGSCIIDGKIERSYRCENHVNHYRSEILENNKGEDWKKSYSNSYNFLNSAFLKLNNLKESDFKQLDGKSETKVQSIMNNAKAGDLLWKGKYLDSDKKTYNGGHIAMIIGLKRNNAGKVIEIEVGEAVGSCGNKLRKWSVSDFVKKSTWVAKSKDQDASFLIKMDDVYNYYTNKYKISDESAKSDCPDQVKSGGNCYKYSEMYNEIFNEAITVKEL